MFSEYVTPVTSDTFEQEVLKSTIPVVVDFWGTTCGPCRMIAPHFNALAEKTSDFGKSVSLYAKFVSINIEENKELAQRLGLRSMPTFRIYRGGEVVYENIGAMNFSGLQLHVGMLVGMLMKEKSDFDNALNTAEPTEVIEKIDVVVDGYNEKNIHIDGFTFPPGTKVLVINQSDPRLNGVRVIGGMTDMDRVRDLLTDLGVGFKEERSTNREFQKDDVVFTITLEKGEEKVGGYNGFSSVYSFDRNGKFLNVSNWE